MLIVISPAKSLDLNPQSQVSKSTMPEFLDDAAILVKKLRRLSRPALSKLMDLSDDLAQLNHRRYAEWSEPFTSDNAKQAVLTFSGAVYIGLDAAKYRAADFTYAQSHLRILSGLFGILRPLDLIQPHRLEMGTKLATRRGKNLYDFWGEKLTTAINDGLEGHRHPTLVNLASNEYFKSVKPRLLRGSVITPVFREVKAGKSRTIATFAKQARGRMVSWIIRNRIDNPADLFRFNADGYQYIEAESTEDRPVFSRPQPAPVRT